MQTAPGPPGDDLSRYPRPSVAADLAIFTIVLAERTGKRGHRQLPDAQLRVLLVRRAQAPFAGQWALPGGFVHPDETLEGAAARELQEETGLADLPLHHLRNYSQPGRDPRGWVLSSTYCALVESSRLSIVGGADAADAGWRDVGQALELDMAFDHRTILADALAWVRHQVRTTLAIRAFLPETFVLAELYGMLKAVVPTYREEPPNFRRKVSGRGIIAPAGGMEARYSQRPAQLFRFTGEAPELSVF